MTFCENTFGTTLATILTGAQDLEANELIKAVAWMGFNDLVKPLEWGWSSGAIVEEVQWAQGQPENRQGEDCGFLSLVGPWHDAPCNEKRVFLCDRRMGVTASENFIFVSTPFEWSGADAYCTKNYGTHLASIHSISEMEEVTRLRTRRVWFGLNDQVRANEYGYVDGSSVDFTNWLDGQPVDSQDECVEIQRNGGWKVVSCNEKRGFICQHPNSKKSILNDLNAMDIDLKCAHECTPDYCKGNSNAMCSANNDNIVDPSNSVDACMHVYCRDCSVSINACIQKCMARQDWFGDDLSCHDACNKIQSDREYRCFNNLS